MKLITDLLCLLSRLLTLPISPVIHPEAQNTSSLYRLWTSFRYSWYYQAAQLQKLCKTATWLPKVSLYIRFIGNQMAQNILLIKL